MGVSLFLVRATAGFPRTGHERLPDVNHNPGFSARPADLPPALPSRPSTITPTAAWKASAFTRGALRPSRRASPGVARSGEVSYVGNRSFIPAGRRPAGWSRRRLRPRPEDA